MRRVTWFAVLGVLLTFCPSALASNVAREVSGWYNDGWNATSHASYMANDHIFSEVNPYWYDLGSQQNLTLTDGTISERAYAYTAQNERDYGKVCPNPMYGTEIGRLVLRDLRAASLRNALIAERAGARRPRARPLHLVPRAG